MSKQLTPAEISDLDRLEKVIETSLANGGVALTQIRDKKLYLRDYDSFEGYCQGRWGWSRKRGDQLIRAAAVIQALPDKMLPMVANERQVRELSKITPEERQKVLKALKDSNTPITAKSIKKALSPEEQAQKDIEEASKPEANGAPKVVRDTKGTPIPEPAMVYWNRKQEVQDMLTSITRLKSFLRGKQEEHDQLFNNHCCQSATESLSAAYTTLTNALPYAVCLDCEGHPELNGCLHCHGTGVMGKYTYERYPYPEKRELREKLHADYIT
jgi:hypothetical protein